jgi:small subunit ribosomal protein S5
MEKAFKDAAHKMLTVSLSGTTIPHAVRAKYSATEILLRPACPGTGIKAGLSARGVLELAGIKDVLTKVFGSTNPLNVVKATFAALANLKHPRQLGKLRNVQIVSPKESTPVSEGTPA